MFTLLVASWYLTSLLSGCALIFPPFAILFLSVYCKLQTIHTVSQFKRRYCSHQLNKWHPIQDSLLFSVRSVCVKSPISNVSSVNLCTCFEQNLLDYALDAQLLRIFTPSSRLRNVFPCSRNLPLDTVLSQLNSVHILTPSFTSCLSPSRFPFYLKFACVLHIRPSLCSLIWLP